MQSVAFEWRLDAPAWSLIDRINGVGSCQTPAGCRGRKTPVALLRHGVASQNKAEQQAALSRRSKRVKSTRHTCQPFITYGTKRFEIHPFIITINIVIENNLHWKLLP